MQSALRLLFAACLLALVAGPTGTALAKDDAPKASADDIKIVNGWIEAPLFDGDEPPVYFTIMNKGAAGRKIVGASSPHADSMELRRAAMVGSTMGSEKLDEFEVPGGGGAVAFVPRGLFLRMIGPKEMADGDKVEVVLEFADGGTASFQAVVNDE